MTERLPIYRFAEAFSFGCAVPAGSLYVITADPIAGLLASLGDGVIGLWFLVITLGTIVLGRWRELSAGTVVGGGIVGSMIGWWGFALIAGWSIVMFPISLVSGLAIVSGAWITHERRRRADEFNREQWTPWRYVFLAIVGLLVGGVALFFLL